MTHDIQEVKQVPSAQSSAPPSPPTRWILTGGAGFLGTNFLRASKEEDGQIVVLDRHPARWPVVKPWIRYIEQDIREVNAFRDELIPGSVVIHMASVSYPGVAERMIETDILDNVLGTIRFAETCADRGVRSLLFLSSGGAIYGNQELSPVTEKANPQPISTYGAMKLTIEHYLRILHNLRNLPVAQLRVGNPFGPWHTGEGQGAVNVFMNKLLSSELIEIWGDGEQVRDYIPVGDAVEAIRQVGLNFSSGCEAFNIGTGLGRSLNDILDSIHAITGREPNVKRLPERKIDVERNILETSKIKSWYGWQSTTPFTDALQETWNWHVSQKRA